MAIFLTDDELRSLSDTLDKLELETLRQTGYNKISGGFATTDIIDYDDSFIDIELTFGYQSDTGMNVTSEQYKVCRKSFNIVN